MAEKIVRACFLNNEAAEFVLDQIDIGLETGNLSDGALRMVEDFYTSLNNFNEIRVVLPPLS